jgi:hypothetical protein
MRRAFVVGLLACFACGRVAVGSTSSSEPEAPPETAERAERTGSTETESTAPSEPTAPTEPTTERASTEGASGATPCRVRSLFVEYDRESDPPAAPARSEVVAERFVDDWSDRDACDRDFDDYAARPMRCAPRARSRAEVRGDVLAPNRVLVGTRDGESLHVIFDERGRTRRIEWDPTASGSFDYAFEYEYDCAR